MTEKVLSKVNFSEVDSFGMIDGKLIISDYLEYNEIGLAFQHLDYTISECDIKVGDEEDKEIETIRQTLNLWSDFLKKLGKRGLTTLKHPLWNFGFELFTRFM